MTFALTAVIVTILINIFLVIRDLYNDSDLKTTLIVNQGNLSNALNSKINRNNLINYSKCDEQDFCFDFSFSDGTISRLVVSSDYIRFGEYVYKMLEGTEVVNPDITKRYVDVSDNSRNDTFLIIDIPIKNKRYPNENFGVKVIYQYNSNTLQI